MEPNQFEKAAMNAALLEYRAQNDFIAKSWRCARNDAKVCFSENAVFCIGVDPERGQVLIYNRDCAAWHIRFSAEAYSEPIKGRLSIRENYITRTGAELNAILGEAQND